MSTPQQDDQRVAIDWPAVIAGAAAAVTVAVLLSTLGAAGTVLGAALGSAVASVATALYKRGIVTSRRKVAEVQAAALMRVGLAQEEVRRAAARSDSPTVESDLARAEAHLSRVSDQLSDAEESAEPPATREVAVVTEPSGRLSWRAIALVALALFVVAMLLISAFELIAGRSVSSLTGGTTGHHDRTSITGVFGQHTGSRSQQPVPSPTPTVPAPTPTPTPTPTQVPPTPSSSSGSPSPTATVTVTVTPTPTPMASASATGQPSP